MGHQVSFNMAKCLVRLFSDVAPHMRSSEVANPRYFAEGTLSKTMLCNMYLEVIRFLSLVICRTWHFDRLKSISQAISQSSSLTRSSCKILASESELMARYMAVSSAKSLTLDLICSGKSSIYAEKRMRPAGRRKTLGYYQR